VVFGFFHSHRGFSPVIAMGLEIVNRFNGFPTCGTEAVETAIQIGSLIDHRAEATV